MIKTDLIIQVVTEDRWPDFEALFESRGAPKTCWCMVWRQCPSAKGPDRKRAMREIVQSRGPVGLLGYLDGRPVAWCSVAPRNSYRQLGGLQAASEEEKSVWSLVCFFIKREVRGHGFSETLVTAAIAHARSQGARILEAYPVDPDSPSYRFMGYLPSFEKFGFRSVGRAGARRHVVQLQLDGEESA